MTEEDLAVTDVSRRNAVFLVTSSSAPNYVVKEAGPAGEDTLVREAAVLTALARVPELAGVVPELVHYDEAPARLVLRSPARALDWGRQTRYSNLTARALGRVLAAVHAAHVEVEPLAARDERLWGLSLPEPPLGWVQSLSAGAFELLARLQADERLCEALARLREESHDPAFVHGDVRWENCLVVAAPGSHRRTRVLLIDWEHAGPGPAELDLAAALAEYLRSWAESFPVVAPGSDPLQLDAGARRPLAVVRPAMLALWTAYRRTSERPVDMLHVTRLAAVRLLESAFEYARGAPVVTGHVLALLQISANMLQAPGFAAWNLLGLRD